MKMEQIGGIDPMVVEEYSETQKRFEFLAGELTDLENAIVSLREVIKEMDSKIGDKFATTYEEINKEFTKYFRIIFGGGNANLIKKKEVRRKAKLLKMRKGITVIMKKNQRVIRKRNEKKLELISQLVLRGKRLPICQCFLVESDH
jgi:chromosome segregation ATPase